MLLHATDEVAFTQYASTILRVGTILNACRTTRIFPYTYVITVNIVAI